MTSSYVIRLTSELAIPGPRRLIPKEYWLSHGNDATLLKSSRRATLTA